MKQLSSITKRSPQRNATQHRAISRCNINGVISSRHVHIQRSSNVNNNNNLRNSRIHNNLKSHLTHRSPTVRVGSTVFVRRMSEKAIQKKEITRDNLDPTQFRPITHPYGAELDIRNRHSFGGNVATVFGSTGLIGRYVVNRLCRTGTQVLLPYRGEEKAYRHMKVMGEVGQIVPFQCDLRDTDLIRELVQKSNIVVNMVSRNYSTRNFDMEFVNVKTAQNIAQAAAEADLDRYIFTSCVGASPTSRSLWARQKFEAEKLTREALPRSTILRLGPIFGPEDRLFNRLGYLQNYWGMVPLLWNKNARFRPLYVRDFAKSITSILAMPETCGRTYELVGPDDVSWDEFVHDVLFEYTLGHWKSGKTFEIPPPANRIIARVLQRLTRKKLFVEDELDWYGNDIYPTPHALGLKDLKITPTSITDYAQSLTALYRRVRIEDSYSESRD